MFIHVFPIASKRDIGDGRDPALMEFFNLLTEPVPPHGWPFLPDCGLITAIAVVRNGHKDHCVQVDLLAEVCISNWVDFSEVIFDFATYPVEIKSKLAIAARGWFNWVRGGAGGAKAEGKAVTKNSVTE
jgi:hypothetical protein